jgi:hypothetical protein
MCARCGHGILKRGASLRPICHVRRRLSALQPPLRNESVESTGTEHSECHAEVALTSISLNHIDYSHHTPTHNQGRYYGHEHYAVSSVREESFDPLRTRAEEQDN